MIINIFGSMCFWCGIIKIISETSLQSRITNLIQPLNIFLFKNIDKTSKAYENINLNLVTNMLGIGNAATPAGIKAMEEMEKDNPHEKKLSDNMVMFLAINTASLQLIPTNIISIRNSLGSANPGEIITSVWFSSFLTFVSIIFITKIYLVLRRKS